MGELVLLVVAAAWAAVLIPPLLRSRIENRPNSSVTDFRRQLNKLQSTVPNRASGSSRGMARPLAQSPLQRPAAAGRPGMQHAHMRRGGTRSHGAHARTATAAPVRATAAPVREAGPRRRSHGDSTSGHARPQGARPQGTRAQGARTPQPSRQSQGARHNVSTVDHVRRRRSNVLFMLVLGTAATLFLAATTQEPALLYLFAAAFLALCAYAYMLSQARMRETSSWPQDWMQQR